MIMSFANRGHQEDQQWTQLFWFDINELPVADEEAILSAHLRIYKHAAINKVGKANKFNMKLSYLVEGTTTDQQLLDSKIIDYSEEGSHLNELSYNS